MCLRICGLKKSANGLGSMLASTHGRPSRSRANLGLNDAIPLGLNHEFLRRLKEWDDFSSTQNSEEHSP